MAIQEIKSLGNWKTENVGEPTHVGLVVGTYSSDGKIMSDVWATFFFAIVWNPTTNSPDHICLGNDEFGCSKTATVDASPEVMAAHQAFMTAKAEREEAERNARYAKEQAEREEAARKDPMVKGRKVTVVKGRKVKPGTTGYVFWTSEANRSYNGYSSALERKVGIATSDRKDSTGKFADVVWCNADHCEATADENSLEEVQARLDSWKAEWVAARESEKTTKLASDKARRDSMFAAPVESAPF